MKARLLPTLMICAALAAGCKTPTSTRPAPKGSAALAVATSQLVEAVTLTGKVKIISDNGGGIISDNGGGIISNNSGAIISNNSGAIVANNGGGLTSKVKRRVLDAGPQEYLLADATVTVQDATGKPVLDAAGKPITAVTDATGSYRLSAALPAGNLVLKVAVHEGGLLAGGELTAMLPKRQGARAAAIDTSTSLGAAYVLGKYVKGDQKTFDKLPADEADKLSANLEIARKLLTTAPRYTQDDLTALTERLRGQAKDLDTTLTEIQALLIGQAGGGDGQQATNAALAGPTGLALGPDGVLYVGEPTLGRIRMVGQDGKIGTLADTLRGKIKRNFPRLTDLVTAPDGTLYVAAESQVFKLTPDGQAVLVAGNADSQPSGLDGPATAAGIYPSRLALGADGTLYIGEKRGADIIQSRLLAVYPTGTIRRVDREGDWPVSDYIAGVAPEPDGTFALLLWAFHGDNTQRVVRLKPGQAPVEIAHLKASTPNPGYLRRADDGTLYCSDPGNNQVLAIAPDGTQRVVAGAGGPAATQDLANPRALALGTDGTLFIDDVRSNFVRALGPDGAWTVRAGTTALEQTRGDLRSLALNGPSSAVFDAQGRLLVAEAGANRIDRFDGGKLEVLAGDGERAKEGDGGLAARARFFNLTCIDERQGAIYAVDDDSLRVIGPDQIIRSVAGAIHPVIEIVEPAARLQAVNVNARSNAIAVAPDGRVYYGTNKSQLLRIEPDGSVTVIGGKGHDNQVAPDAANAAEGLEPKQGDGGPALGATFHGINGLAFDSHGDLYVVDSGAFRVRKITGLDGDRPMIDNFAGLPLVQLLGLADQTKEPPIDSLRRDTMALIAPIAVATDAQDNVYVADAGTAAAPYVSILAGSSFGEAFKALPVLYSHVYKITPDGKVHGVAGSQGKFFPDPTAEDGMVLPFKLAVSADGRMAIVDSGANLIRVLPAHSF